MLVFVARNTDTGHKKNMHVVGIGHKQKAEFRRLFSIFVPGQIGHVSLHAIARKWPRPKASSTSDRSKSSKVYIRDGVNRRL